MTVDEYLASIPEAQRATVHAVRDLILDHLPVGYVESIRWGMLSYEVPLERYPDTYNGEPLAYAGLAARKNYIALYLMGAYGDPERRRLLEERFKAEGKKLDMGKSCLRFRSLDQISANAIGETIARIPVDRFIEQYEASRSKS